MNLKKLPNVQFHIRECILYKPLEYESITTRIQITSKQKHVKVI